METRNSALAAVVENGQEMTFQALALQFPDQWVVLGNPVYAEKELKPVAGIPLVYGTDKRIVCWEGRKMIEQTHPQTYTVVFTGQRNFPKRFMTGIFGRVQ
jgi:hypothetical protein